VLLQQLLDEPERIVRHSIGALISSLAKELVPKGQWASLLDSLLQLCQHPSEGHREVAMMLFTALAENLTKSLQKHFVQLQAIFTRGLSDPALRVRVEALRALSTLVDMLDEDEDGTHAQSFSTVIEPLLGIMGAHFHEDDILCAGFEVLDNLAQSPTAVLEPFIPKIAELMSRILLAGAAHEAGTREKAAYLLEDIIKHKVRTNNCKSACVRTSPRVACM
jgi:leucyl-tRNA synthetase